MLAVRRYPVLIFNQLLRPTQPGHPFVGVHAMSTGDCFMATVMGENGEFCVTVGPVNRTLAY